MSDRIDPDNPSTVPEKYRARIHAAGVRMAIAADGDPSGDCVRQLLCDLLALAHNDGCVAAGWAFATIAGPADDGEPIGAAWLPSMGGESRDLGVREWRLAPASRLCVCRTLDARWACWLSDGRGDTVTLPDLASRGQLRRLLAGLGVPASQGGAPCPE